MEEDGMNELRELISFLKEQGIAEFDMERPDLKVRLKFAGAAAAEGLGSAATMAEMARLMAALQPMGAPSMTVAAAEVPVPAATLAEENLHEVRSLLVGTFYESPSPGAPSFVKVGDHVEIGQVLGIVEAMKLMNEIESDVAGEVVRRVASSGQPVEYGQPLFEIRPR